MKAKATVEMSRGTIFTGMADYDSSNGKVALPGEMEKNIDRVSWREVITGAFIQVGERKLLLGAANDGWFVESFSTRSIPQADVA